MWIRADQRDSVVNNQQRRHRWNLDGNCKYESEDYPQSVDEYEGSASGSSVSSDGEHCVQHVDDQYYPSDSESASSYRSSDSDVDQSPASGIDDDEAESDASYDSDDYEQRGHYTHTQREECEPHSDEEYVPPPDNIRLAYGDDGEWRGNFKPHPEHKKAILVACSYPGTKGRLRGVQSDLNALLEVLTTKLNFSPDRITTLTDIPHYDVPVYDVLKPTRTNILRVLSEHREQAKEGDSLLFTFSGHGRSFVDINCDEVDGQDEAICTWVDPRKPEKRNYILDDELADIFSKFPKGSRVVGLFDSCFSGTSKYHCSPLFSNRCANATILY